MKHIAFAFIAALTIASAAQADSKDPGACIVQIGSKIAYQGTVMTDDGAGFFQAADQYARDNGQCINARIKATERSGRIYRADGSLAALPTSGQKKNLSESEASDVIRANKMGGCLHFICIAADVIETGSNSGILIPQSSNPQTPAQPSIQINPPSLNTGSGSSD